MAKVILITGGSSGIGKSIGEYLKQHGFKVYGTSRSPEKYTNHPFKIVGLDVKDVSSITNAVAEVIAAEGKLDVLINNAGVGITGPIEEISEVEIQNNFDTNFFGPIHVIKAVLPQMRKQNNGLIINITSIAGFMGLPYRGIYSASKGALELLTEAFRIELKDFNVNMSNIAPGDFATNIAAGRYHSPLKEDSPYKNYESVLNDIDTHVKESGDPIAVAKMVLKVVNTKKPKTHYKVGSFMQKFSIVLKFLLPDKVYEKMLIKHYKL
ncbi:SDR family oxidoreductase [Lacinutrix jangbogonensis]|uniref:SDR family oxidoreductase n=1 Tax=Lacinutrix jangbogonensis TaxID=1469557 RepID=UPI00053E7579|nr:SDR family oxidoreductase [Lacinutrix jangbogonensis]